MKRLTTRPFSAAHPWQLYVTPKANNKLSFAIHYYSTLYKPFTESGEFLKYQKLPITGLDQAKEFDKAKIGQGLYIVLNIKVSSLSASSAKIEWIEGKKEDQLFPIKLDKDKKQTEARVVIASYRSDDKFRPGVTSVSKVKRPYIHQIVVNNLILANMVFNGIPVIYPVPITGYAFD